MSARPDHFEGVAPMPAAVDQKQDYNNGHHSAGETVSGDQPGYYSSSSFATNMPFSAAALGATSSASSASLGMSISPPHWASGNMPWAQQSTSYVGSVGALGTSFGRERDRELEAKYVKDFVCCGKQLTGLHELLEHYEEEHANLGANARIAAINAAQNSPVHQMSMDLAGMQSASTLSNHSSASRFQSASQHGEAPTPPGVMDIEMDESFPQAPHSAFLPSKSRPHQMSGVSLSAPASPWAGAFRPQGESTPPHCLPPSLLSYGPTQPMGIPSPDQQAKAARKAQKRADRAALRDDPSASDAEGEKKFACPVEGCGKVYKQANGLKYHLTKSVNGHGHVNIAAIGGVAPFLSDRQWDGRL